MFSFAFTFSITFVKDVIISRIRLDVFLLWVTWYRFSMSLIFFYIKLRTSKMQDKGFFKRQNSWCKSAQCMSSTSLLCSSFRCDNFYLFVPDGALQSTNKNDYYYYITVNILFVLSMLLFLFLIIVFFSVEISLLNFGLLQSGV